MPDQILGVPWQDAIVRVVVCVGFIALLMGAVAYTTLFERKVISRLQVRVGPNRAGPLGLLQPIADGIKLLFKEDIIPITADRFMHRLAPGIAMFAAMAAFAVIPVGPTYDLGNGIKIPAFLANLNVGVLYIIGVASLGVYGLVLGGWASNSKYPLLGALRGAAQLVSYELIVGMSLVGAVMITGTMSLAGMVEWQREHHIPLILLQPVSFLLYLIGAFAETNRPPFDLPEADTELVAGYHTEYSGFRFSMFYLAEYMNMITVSCLASTVFLGGWGGPFGFTPAWIGPIWLVIDVVLFLFFFVWVRATIPRLRYDQLMKLSWSVLLPIGLVNLAVTATVIVLLNLK